MAPWPDPVRRVPALQQYVEECSRQRQKQVAGNQGHRADDHLDMQGPQYLVVHESHHEPGEVGYRADIQLMWPRLVLGVEPRAAVSHHDSAQAGRETRIVEQVLVN